MTRGFLTATGLWILLAGGAEAAPQWLAPGTMVSGGDVEPYCPPATPSCPPNYSYHGTGQAAEVAMDGQGNTTVLFLRYDKSAQLFQVMAVERPAGGAFGAPQAISGLGVDPLYGTSLAVNANGAAIAAWDEGLVVKASYRPPGGSFGPPAQLSNGGAAYPTVLIGSQGDMIAGWQQTDGTYSWLDVAFRPASAPFFSLPAEISPHGTIREDSARFAMNDRGDAVAAWFRDPPDATPEQLETSLRPAGGAFAGVQTLSTSGFGGDPPAVAIDTQGNALAAWTQGGQIAVSRRSANGSFAGAGTPISSSGANSPAVAFEGGGNAVAMWTRQNGSVYQQEESVMPAGGSFSSPAPVGPSASVSNTALSVDLAGDAVAAWTKPETGGGSSLQAAARAPGAGFASPVALFTTAPSNEFFDHVRTGTDGLGDGVALWGTMNVSTLKDGIWVTPYDGAGPQLRGLDVPAQATAGQPATFSVAPVDVWSSVAATTWEFGDGATADGSQVTHTFSAPGDYTIKLTSSDSLGNVSTATRAVSVTPGPTTTVGTPDRTAPVLSAVGMLRTRFAVAKAATPLSARRAKPKRGSAFRYSLSEAATVTIAIDRALPGRRSGRRCVKVKTRPRKGACTRYVRAGKPLTRKRPAGRTVTSFSGRIAKKALPVGTYRATITAVDAARNRSLPKKLTFKIVR